MNSGVDATPTTSNRCFRPLIVTSRENPGRSLCAFANPSLTRASRSRPASGILPACKCSRLNRPCPRGNPTTCPDTGCSYPASSMLAGATTRVSTLTTPGIAATRAATLSGARFSPANSSGNRNSRYILACVRCSESKVEAAITYVAIPPASTNEMAITCPRTAHKSRNSFRFSALSMTSAAPADSARIARRRAPPAPGHRPRVGDSFPARSPEQLPLFPPE